MMDSSAPMGVVAILFAAGVILLMVREIAFAIWEAIPDWLKLSLVLVMVIGFAVVANNMLN
ncbi:MAG TPA: hypothetical protein VLE70_21500 [Anaerolineae bacterium]|jgi:hypothetical protein|nr:hypothetical protein [Anaerolineae bacterium]